MNLSLPFFFTVIEQLLAYAAKSANQQKCYLQKQAFTTLSFKRDLKGMI